MQLSRSDLIRARDTAAIIGKSLDLPVITSTLWRERNYGRWEGLTRAEIQELYPEEWRQYRSSPAIAAPLSGETLAELKVRAIQAMGWVLGKYQGQSGLVFPMGGFYGRYLLGSPTRKDLSFTLIMAESVLWKLPIWIS